MKENIREILGLPITTLYDYWTHYWRSIISQLQSKSNIDVALDSPRYVLEDIILEIKGNRLKNQDNAKYFLFRLSEFDKNDRAFTGLCHPIISTILASQLSEQSCEIVLNLCNKALDILDNGSYHSSLLEELAQILHSDTGLTSENKSSLIYVTKLIVSEFIAKGYELEDIETLPLVVPNVILGCGETVLQAPNDYKGLNRNDFESEELYHEAVSDYIQRRSIKEKLESLYEHFHRTEEDAIALMRLSNIKGDINVQIGDVCIYSPRSRKYISDKDSLSKIEEVDPEYKYLNAAVPIKHLALNSSKKRSKEKLLKILDLINLGLNKKNPVGIMQNEFVLVKDGKEIGQSTCMEGNDPRYADRQPEFSYLESFDAEQSKADLEWIASHFVSFDMNKNIQIQNSMHWLYKANQSEKNEDILLFSWFSLESLLKIDEASRQMIVIKGKNLKGILSVIQEIVCYIMLKHTFHNKIWDVYEKQIYFYKNHDNYYDVPENIAHSAAIDLEEGEKYRIKDFFEHLNVLMNSLNDEIEKDKLKEVYEFYRRIDSRNRYFDSLKNDLLMIYRLRNMMVHNAMIQYIGLDNYAKKINYIACVVLRYFLTYLKNHPESTIFDFMVETVASGKVFMDNYEYELKKKFGKL